MPRAAAPSPAAAPAGLGADVTDKLKSAAPTFAEVLSSVGLGVAASQAALDKGVLDAVGALSDKKVKFVSTITTKLDDSGLPVPPGTDANGNPDNLTITEVSAINFFSPTVHEWKQVALAMDLEVGALDSKSGVTFSQTQASAKTSGGVSFLWGFSGWFSLDSSLRTTNISTTRQQESNWSQGSVRIDAQLGPRRTERLPVPGSLKRAPLFFLSPGAVTEAAGVRKLTAKIEARKLDGSANAGVILTVSAPGLGVSFPATATTDANGRIEAVFQRRQLGDPKLFRVEIGLGDLVQPFDLSI
jgi:hypothetical protein